MGGSLTRACSSQAPPGHLCCSSDGTYGSVLGTWLDEERPLLGSLKGSCLVGSKRSPSGWATGLDCRASCWPLAGCCCSSSTCLDVPYNRQITVEQACAVDALGRLLCWSPRAAVCTVFWCVQAECGLGKAAWCAGQAQVLRAIASGGGRPSRMKQDAGGTEQCWLVPPLLHRVSQQ